MGILLASLISGAAHAVYGFGILTATTLFIPSLVYLVNAYLKKDTNEPMGIKKKTKKELDEEDMDILGWKQEEPKQEIIRPQHIVEPQPIAPQKLEPIVSCGGCKKVVYEKDTLFNMCKDCAYKEIERVGTV